LLEQGHNHLAKQSAQRSDSTGEPIKGSPEATSLFFAGRWRIGSRSHSAFQRSFLS
jgi:hypothetical protein